VHLLPNAFRARYWCAARSRRCGVTPSRPQRQLGRAQACLPLTGNSDHSAPTYSTGGGSVDVDLAVIWLSVPGRENHRDVRAGQYYPPAIGRMP
jgi:hypothetical protein